ncbi:formate dehydrogenase accessory sulfurtransferase FdhD [Ornithinibacillus gellani]|uniref:formate dehydrogenase accessory sulfurtransferase FdhD n=1 Tax=Ornithinibacillus gellani TaxID=2293253 RepID=UPI000F485ACA|nr:formate dehydrogenase accessory sulfurtransferase FdhD [Ornithinibacillus gellani]TQS74091.1 formate dehydrogenase accessory sulfurtransferase FdhD [Ornithinibacillus gellani]
MKNVTQNGWKTVHYQKTNPIVAEERIAVEFPLTIMLNGEEFATMVCTPTHMEELLIGFLASEGIIRFYDEIRSLHVDEQKGFAYIELDRSIDDLNIDHSKRVIGSCCGKSRQFYFKSDVKTAKTITSKLHISVSQCYALMHKLESQSEHFQQTGGVHNAALCTVDEVLQVRTDIGRHNALDKIYGDILMHPLPLRDKLIVFSGRISSEVLLKVSKIGVGILLSKSAPTNLALQLAEDLGITTAGFVRGQSMNVYTHPERIIEES